MSKKIFVHRFLGTIFILIFSGFFYSIAAQEIPLRPNKTTSIKNSRTPTYSYKIEAQKDQIISLEIKQNGIDLSAKLFDKNNLLLAESDIALSEQDIEKIFVVAPESSSYRLELAIKFPNEKGSAVINLADFATVTSKDFKRAEAVKLFSNAQKLRATGVTADRKTALDELKKALPLFRESEDKIGELRALVMVAYLCHMIGRYDESERFVKTILDFPNNPEYGVYKAQAILRRTHIANESKYTNSSIENLKNALTLFPRKAPEQTSIYVALGYTYYNLGEYDSSEKAFQSAFDNLRLFPDIYDEGQLWQYYGLFKNATNEFDDAVSAFSKAAKLREKTNNKRGRATSLSYLGMTYITLKNYEEAHKAVKIAFELSKELGDVNNQIDSLIYLAICERAFGNLQKALDHYNQAASYYSNKNLLSAPLLLSMGVTHLQMSNFAESRNFFALAMDRYRRKGDLGGESLVYFHQGRLERAENNLDAARLSVEKSLKLDEYAQTKFTNIRLMTSYFENRRRYYDLYIDVLMKLHEQRPNENFAFKAMQASESARMRTLILQLREALKDSPQTVDFQILTDLQKVQQQIGEQLNALSKAQSNGETKEKIDGIETNLSELNKQNERLKANLRQANPNFASLAFPPTLTLEQMQKELDDETVLIEYSLGEFRSYLWIVSKNGFQSFILPKRADIDLQAQNVYQTLSETSNSPRSTDKKVGLKKDFATESNKLGQMLAIDKFANLPAKRLIFVTDGSLNSIPFGSLSFQNKFISEKFETINLPSLSTLHILRQNFNKPFNSNSLAILADPVFSATDERIAKAGRTKNKMPNLNSDLTETLRDFNLNSLARLPFSRIEAEKIEQEGGQSVNLNLGFKASRERLLDGEFDNFDILHFATHGFLNNKHPELSGLVLSLVDEKGNSQNGFLRTQDLYLLKLRPQMVVLSACQTGIGKQIENEGFMGMARGFLANGTPRIIATLWKVDDAASAELMGRFYRAMFKENKKPSEALQTAQNELRQIPRYAHPRYWAGFVLTGEWR